MRFNSLWLYTLLTVVSSVVCCQAFAEGGLSDAAIKRNEETCQNHPTPGESFTQCLIKLNASSSGGAGAGAAATDPNSCSTLSANLSKEDGEFRAACSEVGRSGTSCDTAFYSCNQCNVTGEDEAGAMCDEADVPEDDGEGYESSSSTFNPYNLAGSSSYKRKKSPAGMIAKFRACPSVALNQIKDLKSDLKELRDDEKSLKDKINEKKLDIQKVEADISSTEATYQEDKNKAKVEFEAKQEELQGELKGKVKELNDQLSTQQNELTGLMNSRDTLVAKYTEQVAAIENVCEAEAERELTKRREAYVKELQSSNARQSSISNLLKLRLKGRNTDDEEFRKRAILRCQQNPARYQKPIALLNNQFLLNKRDLETAISQKQAAIQKTQQDIVAANPEIAEKVQKLTDRYNEQVTLLTNSRNSKIGTCGAAPAVMGQNSTQNGASNCSGLMAQKNIEEQNLQRYNAELTEKQDDITYTQQLYDAAADATGGNTSGHSSAEDISVGGSGVKTALEALGANCAADSRFQNWNAQYKRLTGEDLPSGANPAVLTPGSPGPGGVGGAVGGTTVQGGTRTPVVAPGPGQRPTQ